MTQIRLWTFIIGLLPAVLSAQGHFTIRLGVYPEPQPSTYFASLQLSDSIQERKHLNNHYHYFTGSFSTYLDAELKLARISQKGWPKAEIIDLEEQAIMESMPCPMVLEDMQSAVLTRYVFFDAKSTALRTNYKKELDHIAEILKANPGYKIYLSGHTDNDGERNANLEVSAERIRSVRNYLIDRHKIHLMRIETFSCGASKPLLPNEDQFNTPNLSNRALNNRVTLTLTYSQE